MPVAALAISAGTTNDVAMTDTYKCNGWRLRGGIRYQPSANNATIVHTPASSGYTISASHGVSPAMICVISMSARQSKGEEHNRKRDQHCADERGRNDESAIAPADLLINLILYPKLRNDGINIRFNLLQQ